MSYNHEEIDAKWQKRWEDEGTFKVQIDPQKKKFFALDMFPYPSGQGLHVGHLASYCPTEIVSRYKKAQGFNVLHPMGYDAFGLPAEQYAIQTGIHPAETTKKAIDNFRRQLKSFGYSFDWSREVATCDSEFYKWTQFIFLKLFEKGLAYQKEVPVNWCPELKTVLANEEVIDGKSERGGHPVIRKPMKQWMLKITDYSERLINDLDKINWPERTKEAQKYWIGKSEGAEVDFQIKDSDKILRVFTTRPDTLFGVTFMVIAPEHPYAKDILSSEQKESALNYITNSARKSDIERKANTEKTGVFTGSYVIHPLNNQPLPIWIADYVLMDYGTGAIMAVPGHDNRDFEFATCFGLNIVRVLESQEDLPFEGDGKLVNSDFLNGLDKDQAIEKIGSYLEQKKLGKKTTQYKLRDWLFSRQRYWGEPFPVVDFNGEIKPVPLSELPVTLPEVENYEPTSSGEPPLAKAEKWVQYKDPQTEKTGKRITDTMPGSAGSSWYFLRYTDPHNDQELASLEAQKYWMPVDLYIGGPEHTYGHLLYARFWQKVLFDEGLASCDEPFIKLAHQGMILGADGEKMSKSRGNTINPDDVRLNYGADAVRLYVAFMGPMDKDKPWATNGIEGVRRFLERLWRLCLDENEQPHYNENPPSETINRALHKTIRKVTEDIEKLSFNTAVSAMMILVNDLYKANEKPRSVLLTLCQLLMPFAPHISEELWEKLEGDDLVTNSSWPQFDPQLTIDDEVEMGVQINGKMRGTILVSDQTTEEQALNIAKELLSVQNALEGKKILKVIYKAKKILNIVAK